MLFTVTYEQMYTCCDRLMSQNATRPDLLVNWLERGRGSCCSDIKITWFNGMLMVGKISWLNGIYAYGSIFYGLMVC